MAVGTFFVSYEPGGLPRKLSKPPDPRATSGLLRQLSKTLKPNAQNSLANPTQKTITPTEE